MVTTYMILYTNANEETPPEAGFPHLMSAAPVAGTDGSLLTSTVPEAKDGLSGRNGHVLLFPTVLPNNRRGGLVGRVVPIAVERRGLFPSVLPEAEENVTTGNLDVLLFPTSLSNDGGVICGVRCRGASCKDGDDDESDEDSECLTHDDSS